MPGSVPEQLLATVRSAPRTPVHLGLAGLSASRSTSVAARRTAPSLSIRTADGSRVSILNDCDDSAASDHKRCSSVPGLSPGGSPGAPFRAQSTPGAATPQALPAMLPSLSTLVQAVRMVSATPAMPLRRSISSGSGGSAPSSTTTAVAAAGPHFHPYQPPSPRSAPPGTKTTGKRKYKCSYGGCGKAFTTSGHLARHQRIHTGEKNFACLFPGCASRFSRQDNMMQHYRTHLSSKSRRNPSPRKVVFVEPAAAPAYAAQVFAGSHPIQHHQPLHAHGPAAAPPPPLRAHVPAHGAPPLSHKAPPPPYGLPPAAAAGRHYVLPKQSPPLAHGPMPFY